MPHQSNSTCTWSDPLSKVQQRVPAVAEDHNWTMHLNYSIDDIHGESRTPPGRQRCYACCTVSAAHYICCSGPPDPWCRYVRSVRDGDNQNICIPIISLHCVMTYVVQYGHVGGADFECCACSYISCIPSRKSQY